MDDFVICEETRYERWVVVVGGFVSVIRYLEAFYLAIRSFLVGKLTLFLGTLPNIGQDNNGFLYKP